MRSSLSSPLVRLHNVELRAVSATDLVRITVVVAVSDQILPRGVLGWHANKVESRDTPTVRLGEVNVVLDRAAKEVGRIELVGVEASRLREVASITELDVESFTR